VPHQDKGCTVLSGHGLHSFGPINRSTAHPHVRNSIPDPPLPRIVAPDLAEAEVHIRFIEPIVWMQPTDAMDDRS
jgi:hypothetical protein